MSDEFIVGIVVAIIPAIHMMLIICRDWSLEKIQESVNQFYVKSSDVRLCFAFPSF